VSAHEWQSLSSLAERLELSIARNSPAGDEGDPELFVTALVLEFMARAVHSPRRRAASTALGGAQRGRGAGGGARAASALGLVVGVPGYFVHVQLRRS
jgi:hypothetical protein